jgi:pyruvate dehydrogenase E1 component alpha subunit
VAVGVCSALKFEDYVLSTHRSHAHYLAKGGNLKAMIAELYGRQAGCCKGKGGSMHLFDKSVNFCAVPIVGSTIPIAVGTAFATLFSNKKLISVVFFGDAAVEEGVFYESMNFASLKKLPIIFVCENNLFAVYSPLKVRQPANRSNLKIADGHGIKGYQGDGNNVMEVYNLAKAAIEKARNGEGPTFLEFSTYRWREHCGPNYDNHLGYRTENEFEAWKLRDPIKQLEKQGIHISEIEQMINKINKEINKAFLLAKNDQFPDESMLFEHVYAN